MRSVRCPEIDGDDELMDIDGPGAREEKGREIVSSEENEENCRKSTDLGSTGRF